MIRYLLPLLVLATPVAAQTVSECGDRASARSLVEPWNLNSDTYGDGAIRVAVLDMLEPASAAVHLMVISPPLDEIGDRQCRLISLDQTEQGYGIGFMNLEFGARAAEYDPARGLVLTMPSAAFNPDTGAEEMGELTVTINQQTGEVTAEVSGS